MYLNLIVLEIMIQSYMNILSLLGNQTLMDPKSIGMNASRLRNISCETNPFLYTLLETYGSLMSTQYIKPAFIQSF